MKNISALILGAKVLPRVIRLAVLLGIIAIASIFSACSPPKGLPEGPTPIPTLIPVTVLPSNIQPTEVTQLVVESYPAGLPSALAGQSLYGEYCASCHGIDGNGLVPNARNFGDVDYMRGETPANFYVIISEGRGVDMPAFGDELSSDDRWAIVYYIWRFSTSDETLQGGHGIYQGNCAACHGEDGRSLILGAANFPDQRFMANRSPSDLYVSITQGLGSMPAWQARLSQDERWAVIDFIRTFTYDPQVGETVATDTTVSTSTEDERPECAPYLDQVNPFDWDNADAIAAGQSLYDLECSGCHGEDGIGRLPGIIDFTDPATQADLQKNPYKYFCSIAEGYQRMPQFKSEFNEEEIWQLLIRIAAYGQ